MAKLFKLIVWTALGIIGVFAAAFIFGAAGAIFGFYEPPEKIESATSPPEVTQTAKPEAMAPSQPLSKISVPVDMSAQQTYEWLTGQGFIGSKDGQIIIEYKKFARLSLGDSLALHKGFKTAAYAADIKPSTAETESEKSRFEAVQTLVFAGASALTPKDRREYAKKTGAVLPPSAFHDGTHIGDYIKLLNWHKERKAEFAAYPIREYAKIMNDKEITGVLAEIGAVTFPDHAYSGRRNNKWQLHPGEALSHYDAETLKAFHDAIDDTMFGDRPKLRRKIRKIIASRHTADDMTEDMKETP